MTMLSIFEEELEQAISERPDIACAACSASGHRLDGTLCSSCAGAGWLELGDHDAPCMPCTGKQRHTRPDPPLRWQIVGDWHLCGLCGVRTQFNQGGTSTGGAICDQCASLDSCDTRTDERGTRHVSRWGIAHTLSEHDELVRGQQRRRARFLATSSPNEGNDRG